MRRLHTSHTTYWPYAAHYIYEKSFHAKLEIYKDYKLLSLKHGSLQSCWTWIRSHQNWTSMLKLVSLVFVPVMSSQQTKQTLHSNRDFQRDYKWLDYIWSNSCFCCWFKSSMNKIAIYMKIRRDINTPLGEIIKYCMSYQPQPPVPLWETERRQMAR